MEEVPIVIQDCFMRLMCIMLRPHEIEDVLHHRFSTRAQNLREHAEKPTDTVLLLMKWFEQYFRRFPELHLFSPRISPVVECIDERIAFDISPYFVRDHILLLLLQTLNAYNAQRVWGRDWFSTQRRGGPEDQLPS